MPGDAWFGEHMPGPMSDSYDPEFGTSSNCEEIREALSNVYDRITGALGGAPPLYVLDLVRSELPRPISAILTEKEWRLIRFALERAQDSI